MLKALSRLVYDLYNIDGTRIGPPNLLHRYYFRRNSIINSQIPLKASDAQPTETYQIKDSAAVEDATERLRNILDAKYEAANLQEVCKGSTHLSKDEQQKLYALLPRYESLFVGTLRTWEEGSGYNIKLKPDAQPCHARAFPIPRVHLETLKHGNRTTMRTLGVLTKVNRSE